MIQQFGITIIDLLVPVKTNMGMFPYNEVADELDADAEDPEEDAVEDAEEDAWLQCFSAW